MAKVVTLGEIMLRLSTQSGFRLQQTDNLAIHYGGAEANVAISLANYQHEVSFASKVPNNLLGTAVQQHLQRYKVSTKHLLSGGDRLGTYFVETGFGERGAKILYDREKSSFSTMEDLEWKPEELFQQVDLFHLSGITPALSKNWQELTLKLIKEAKKQGVKISFDINYRNKLWPLEEAKWMIQTIIPFVDYCSAGKLDAIHFFDYPIGNQCQEEISITECYQFIQKKYPTIQAIFSTERFITSANQNDLLGTLWIQNNYFESKEHALHIVDRIGGGDAFAAGILHGILNSWTPQKIIDFATAAAALKHTVHGDCNQFSELEIFNFLQEETGEIIR